MRIELVDGAGGYALLPVQTFGTLFGTQVYVSSLDVCYKVSSQYSWINKTSVFKHNGKGDGVVPYLESTEALTSIDKECVTLSADTPRVPIDDATWVEFLVLNINPFSGPYFIDIYSVELSVIESME